ncbi:MAG: transcription-repair coupling factor [Candidatus Methylomirabilia bacterium]
MIHPAHGLMREIAATLRKGPARLTLRGAVAPARPFLAAALHRALHAPVLVITAGNREAERFRDEAAFWLPRTERALLFPAREILPFEPLSPEPGIAAARMATLAALAAGAGRPLVVAPLEAALQYLIPRSKIHLARLDLQRGGTLEWDRFRRHLVQWGFRPVQRVAEPGEFSQRGGIVDLFPPAQPAPVRIELFGDEVDSIHAFDVETQRNTGTLERVVVLPAREVFLDGGVLGALKKHLIAPEGGPAGGESWLAQHAAALPGLEHYGAALLHSRQTLLDYFATPPVLLLDEWPDLESRAGKLEEEIAQGLARAALPGLADPQRIFVEFARWRAGIKELGVVQFDLFGLAPDADREFSVETATGRAFLAAGGAAVKREGHLPAAVKTIAAAQGRSAVLVVARTPEDADRIGELCRELGLGTAPLDPAAVPGVLTDPRPGAPLLTWGPPEEGFSWPAAGIAVLTEDDLFGTRVRAHAAEGPPRGTLVPDFALLRPGDLLVHTDYGIGRFGGLVRLPAAQGEGEFLLLLYQDDAKLYVPVGAVDRVQRYIAAEGVRPVLDRLGGRGWVTTKKRAKKAMLGMARELLELAALRQHAPGHAFAADSPWQAEFEMAFEYEPTKDQLRAAEETKADMERPHPMDRLICGDVGYGKTEVAMRAAFKAVMDGKQVALLAPTTVLAQQHFLTFRERFAPWPTRIEVLSRFVTPKEQHRVIKALAQGEVDILIGTHRIVGKDIVFSDLGLLIIDEEQRFGVRHKEALKRMRAHVDVLTLTATPIPRTLHLALSGLRELSLVATPPENRLAIQTTIARFEPGLVADAVRRELARGGQVFFVHNRVKSIFRVAAWLARLVPEARIGVGHGQMAERELSRVMAAFRGGTLDVLVSTSIVESGLDIPNANTMIVSRADAFGLAELYQLRGRIGRSRHRAFAYLLIPGENALSDTARRRIEVLREYSHLGAGFQVALFDLEIRGAGNIVGYEQSGQIAALGFEMYAQLLRDTIRELQGEPIPEERPTQVTISLPTVLPEAYVAEAPQRLGFYKRIAAARTPAALEEAAAELRERFGPLPEPAHNLLRVARLRLAGETLGLERIDWHADTFDILARRGAAVAPERVVALVARSGGRARLAGENRLTWRWRSRDADGRLAEALELLSGLG